MAGYADQRGLQLLVSSGFSPEQTVAITTSNGARFLHDRTVGPIAEGLQADLVVLRGNPSRQISDVRNVEVVFKDGVAMSRRNWCVGRRHARRVHAGEASCSRGQSSLCSPFWWPGVPHASFAAVDQHSLPLPKQAIMATVCEYVAGSRVVVSAAG